jgi:hypothetical protein
MESFALSETLKVRNKDSWYTDIFNAAILSIFTCYLTRTTSFTVTTRTMSLPPKATFYHWIENTSDPCHQHEGKCDQSMIINALYINPL